ncbi:MAG: hypothetical protein ACKO7X_07545 [Bacteroidota bacterium]
MKKLIQSLLLLGSLVTLLALSSCKKDEPTPTPTPAFNGFTIGSQKYPISKGWILPFDTGYVGVIFASNTISDSLTGTGNILTGIFAVTENSITLNTGIYALSSSDNPMTCDVFGFFLNAGLDEDPNYVISSDWNTNKTVSVAKESDKYVLTFSGIVAKDTNDVSVTTSANIKVPLTVLDDFFGAKSSDMGLNDNQFHALRQKLQKFRQRATQR